MPQMNESTAEKLEPVQAAELVRVIDLQARWENMRGNPIGAESGGTVLALQGRQKAYEAFRTRLVAYANQFQADDIPDTTLNTPARVMVWCRVVRAIFRRAERETVGDTPVHVVAKAYRLADRLALLGMKDPVERGSRPDSVGAAIRDLDAVVLWCDGLAGPPAAPNNRWPTKQPESSDRCEAEDAAA